MLPFGTPRAGLLHEVDDWRDRLDRKGALIRAWEGRLRRDLEAESVAASTALEGIPVTANDVRRILVDDRPRSVSPADAKLVVGYGEAMHFVLRHADDRAFRWDRGFILNLHDRVLGGSFAAGAGRFREGETSLVDRATGRSVFEPPPGRIVPKLVDELFRAMTSSREHPAVQAAWVHVAIAAIHPFRDGNGRVSRILASLAMYRGGFKRKEFTSLEEWWGSHSADYYAAFRCLGPRFDPQADVSSFIDSHVRAQLEQVRRLDLRERTERQIWLALEQVCADRGLAGRVANALWDAFHEREITARYYRGATDVSRATATNDLAAATAGRLLRSIGERRARRYAAGEELYVSVARLLNLPEGVAKGDARSQIVARLAQQLLDVVPASTASRSVRARAQSVRRE